NSSRAISPASPAPFPDDRASRFCLIAVERYRRPQAVVAIKAARIGLERGDHFRKRLPQRMTRLPSKKFARAGDVEFIVLVGTVAHPWFNEGVMEWHVIFQPRAGFRHGFGDFAGFPFFVMNEAA